MSEEQTKARRRADGCAIGAEALTPLLLVLKDARDEAARKLSGPVRVEFDALAILREAAEQWPGQWVHRVRCACRRSRSDGQRRRPGNRC